MNEEASTLNLVDLLDRLEPIPEPAPVSMWPQTAGWIWLGIVLAAGMVWLVWYGLRRYRANAYRRAALREIAAAAGEPAAIAGILRRAALVAYPRDTVAGLHGAAWLAFLDRSYGGTGFCEGAGRAMTVAPYARPTDTPDLTPLAEVWVRRHRTDAGSAP